jgi:hypothetical protein
MAQAKPKSTPRAAETAPGSFIIDPAQVPDRYVLIVQGDCMAPLHRDGAAVIADKHAPYKAGDLVVIYIKPELVKPGRCSAMLKRLVSIPHWATSFPFSDHPESAVIAIASVETLNPPRRIHYRCEDILAIHRCTGAAPVEITWINPPASRVHASDVTRAKPSRRAVLAGIASSPAFAAPALALSGAEPDPIFAAIKRHKALNVAFSEVLHGMSEFETKHGVAAAGIDEWEQREHETSNAERDACDEMTATVPTTLAGLLTLLRYVEGEHDRGEKILDENGLEELISVTVTALAAVVGKPAGEVVS